MAVRHLRAIVRAVDGQDGDGLTGSPSPQIGDGMGEVTRQSVDYDNALWKQLEDAMLTRPGTKRQHLERALRLWLEVVQVPAAFAAPTARAALEAWANDKPPWDE